MMTFKTYFFPLWLLAVHVLQPQETLRGPKTHHALQCPLVFAYVALFPGKPSPLHMFKACLPFKIHFGS